jgi:lantibiotic leader peptide-processing serine protease
MSGAFVALVTLSGLLAVAPPTHAAVAAEGPPVDYVVLARDGSTLTAATSAAQRLGGSVVRSNQDVSMLTVTATRTDFAEQLSKDATVEGVTRNVAIGRTGTPQLRKGPGADGGAASATAAPAAIPGAEPLAGQQWDMAQIGATPTGSYRIERGSKSVKVGIIDSGIDATHPDIAPNLDLATSRNFAPNIPALDGNSNLDPVGTDPFGHGTAVASLVAAPINGIGMAGVAPNVTLVDLRAGQPSGYVLVEPVVNALTYAARNGIDVVTMSFSIDPWLWNCVNNAADTPAERSEQRATIAAVLRAVLFARSRGVTMVAAAGNENIDMDHSSVDSSSPSTGVPHDRTIDPNSCFYLPVMAPGVIGVGGTNIDGIKADLSNYGRPVDLAAPSGDVFHVPGVPGPIDSTNRVVQAISRDGALNNRWINADGVPINPRVFTSCTGATCAYYVYQIGTSVSVPHVAGVAALIISKYGSRQPDGGLGMDPSLVSARLFRTATPKACPATYDDTFGPATCAKNAKGTTFYGFGVVNAAAAVR